MNNFSFSMQEEREVASKDIKITPSVKKKLDHMKIHYREPYHEVIARLIDYFEKQELTAND